MPRSVIGVGTGVKPEEYGQLSPLAAVLGAELAATRKVTDRGWAPRSRQVGITGRSIAPRLYVALGLSGKFNHMVGVRAAGTILAVNEDPEAPVFAHCDVGIVGDWHEVVPLLQDALRRQARQRDDDRRRLRTAGLHPARGAGRISRRLFPGVAIRSAACRPASRRRPGFRPGPRSSSKAPAGSGREK